MLKYDSRFTAQVQQWHHDVAPQIPIGDFVTYLEPKLLGLEDEAQFYAPVELSVHVKGAISDAAGAMRLHVPVHANNQWLPTLQERIGALFDADSVELKDVCGRPLSDFSLDELDRVGKLHVFVDGKKARLNSMPEVPLEYSINKLDSIYTWYDTVKADLPKIVAQELIQCESAADLVEAIQQGGRVEQRIASHLLNTTRDVDEFVRVNHMNSPYSIEEGAAHTVFGSIASSLRSTLQEFISASSKPIQNYYSAQEAKKMAERLQSKGQDASAFVPLFSQASSSSVNGFELFESLAESMIGLPAVTDDIVNTIYVKPLGPCQRWQDEKAPEAKSDSRNVKQLPNGKQKASVSGRKKTPAQSAKQKEQDDLQTRRKNAQATMSVNLRLKKAASQAKVIQVINDYIDRFNAYTVQLAVEKLVKFDYRYDSEITDISDEKWQKLAKLANIPTASFKGLGPYRSSQAIWNDLKEKYDPASNKSKEEAEPTPFSELPPDDDRMQSDSDSARPSSSESEDDDFSVPPAMQEEGSESSVDDEYSDIDPTTLTADLKKMLKRTDKNGKIVYTSDTAIKEIIKGSVSEKVWSKSVTQLFINTFEQVQEEREFVTGNRSYWMNIMPDASTVQKLYTNLIQNPNSKVTTSNDKWSVIFDTLMPNDESESASDMEEVPITQTKQGPMTPEGLIKSVPEVEDTIIKNALEEVEFVKTMTFEDIKKLKNALGARWGDVMPDNKKSIAAIRAIVKKKLGALTPTATEGPKKLWDAINLQSSIGIHNPLLAQLHHTIKPINNAFPAYYTERHLTEDMTENAPYSAPIAETYDAYHLYAGMAPFPEPIERKHKGKKWKKGKNHRRRMSKERNYSSKSQLPPMIPVSSQAPPVRPIGCGHSSSKKKSAADDYSSKSQLLAKQMPPMIPVSSQAPPVRPIGCGHSSFKKQSASDSESDSEEDYKSSKSSIGRAPPVRPLDVKAEMRSRLAPIAKKLPALPTVADLFK